MLNINKAGELKRWRLIIILYISVQCLFLYVLPRKPNGQIQNEHQYTDTVHTLIHNNEGTEIEHRNKAQEKTIQHCLVNKKLDLTAKQFRVINTKYNFTPDNK
jgi:hypothetical protein